MILDVLAQLVIDADLGVPGVSLFIMSMPASVEHGIVLKTPLTGVPLDEELPGFFHHKVQAIVRARKPEEGRRLARQLQHALSVRQRREFVIEDVEVSVSHVIPLTEPVEYPRQDGNTMEFSLNFRAVYCHNG